jgi:hypothetical protein
VGAEVEAILRDWIAFLIDQRQWQINDPLFPKSGVVRGIGGGYVFWGQQTFGGGPRDIYRMTMDGGSPEVVSSGYGPITDMVLLPNPVSIAFVDIDVTPHKKKTGTAISYKRDKYINVVVFGSMSFDALQIDLETVAFGPSGAPPVRYHVKDLNRDGFGDVALTFEAYDTGIVTGETSALLLGKTLGRPVTNIVGGASFIVEP